MFDGMAEIVLAVWAFGAGVHIGAAARRFDLDWIDEALLVFAAFAWPLVDFGRLCLAVARKFTGD